MKHEIEIRNGSGWNHYQALSEFKTLPPGTKGLMASNRVARLEIAPYHHDKPLGVGARFYNENGDEVFCLQFDQNDTAGWIAQRIVKLLVETIDAARERRQRAIDIEALKAAQAAGYDTPEAHKANLAAAREALAEAHRAILADPAQAQAAKDELTALRAAHREAIRITRKGHLVNIQGQPVAHFTNLDGLRAWLNQNGCRASIDDRQHFWNACRAQ